MNTQRLFLFGIIFTSALFAASPALAASQSELRIKPDGTFSATNAVVVQKSGPGNFFCRVVWDKTFARIVVLTHDASVVYKDHGEKTDSNDIKEGDVLDVTGTLANGDGSMVIDAATIRDHSLQIEKKTLSGAIASVDLSSNSFTLPHKALGPVVVSVGTTTIQKGLRTISLADLSAGDKILSVSGFYNYTTKTLSASEIRVYQNPTVFIPRAFKGTLVGASATTLPTTLTVTSEGKTYTVYLSATSSILSSNKLSTDLSRFVAGDSLRFFGAIRQTNLNEIDASTVRDLKF